MVDRVRNTDDEDDQEPRQLDPQRGVQVPQVLPNAKTPLQFELGTKFHLIKSYDVLTWVYDAP